MKNEVQVMSIRDGKAGAFLPPYYCPTVAVGLRQFTFAIQDESTDFGKWPEDYVLFHLGQFDHESGTFQLLDTPELVMTGLQGLKAHKE